MQTFPDPPRSGNSFKKKRKEKKDKEEKGEEL